MLCPRLGRFLPWIWSKINVDALSRKNMIWLSHYEYCCLYGLYYAKSCKLDTQLSEKTTLNFVLLLFLCLACNVVMCAASKWKVTFMAYYFSHVACWSSGASITTTSSQEKTNRKPCYTLTFWYIGYNTRILKTVTTFHKHIALNHNCSVFVCL